MAISDRKADLDRFYGFLGQLVEKGSGLARLRDATGRQNWPDRGVYFFFEDGEDRESGVPRVVRVGTHALHNGAKSTLWSRLSQHRGSLSGRTGNHRGSVFRDLVGQAIAKRDELSVPSWGRGRNADRAILDLEVNLEGLVSQHIGAMKFVCLEVGDEPSRASLRGFIERNAIALLSNYVSEALDPASPGWLGHLSDREKVRQSGLWNNQHVDERYDPEFLDVMEGLVDGRAAPRVPQKSGQIYVIQCAKSKKPEGYLRDPSGQRIMFVADPASAPKDNNLIYAHPDDLRTDGLTWRQYLIRYNAKLPDNPDGLHRAIELYANPAYRLLGDACGAQNVYVLSAGWGLVRGDFLLPQYDITLSQTDSATVYMSRVRHPHFDDLAQFPTPPTGRLCLLGGRAYLPLFLHLTRRYSGPRAVYFSSDIPPDAPGCDLIHYETETRTNWHYALVKDLVAGRVSRAGTAVAAEPIQQVRPTPKAPRPRDSSSRKPNGPLSGKYAPLYGYLVGQPKMTSIVTLTYRQIANILGRELPPSATTHASVWWANGGHPQADSWMLAGFRKKALSIGPDAERSWVRFERDESECKWG